MKKLFTLFILSCIMAMSAFQTNSIAQVSNYFNGFETTVGSGDWGSTLIRSSGYNGITSAAGSKYGETTTGDYTRFGGYNYSFPAMGFKTSIDIYLNVDGGYLNDKRFDYSSAISSLTAHRRDFIFNGGFYNDAIAPGTGNRFVITTNNNTPGWPRDPSRSKIVISTSGWYTFEHFFRNNGGVLAVDLNIYNSSHVLIGTWTLSDPTDIIGSTVGGNRYGWFVTNELGTLAIDNSSLTLVPVPPVHNITQNTYFNAIQPAINAASTGDVIECAAGTYSEDVTINKSITLKGAGYASTTVIGPIGGTGATMQVAAANVVIDGFTITRAGNNTTDWNNAGLNSAGIAVQSQGNYAEIKNNLITGMRTAIDINNSNGNNIHNNIITDNRTGFIFRNQTDNTYLTENEITDNWTVGVLFLDGSVGTNSPVQTAANCTFSNNNISGNWYGQVVDRQSGGSLPAPGANMKNFECNWYGTNSPIVSTANSSEPGYAALIPVAFGGTAVAPSGQPDICGPASANIDYITWLTNGTDSDGGEIGFQPVSGSCTGAPVYNVTQGIPYTLIQPAIDGANPGDEIHVSDGTFVGALNINKDNLTIIGSGSTNTSIIDASAATDYGVHISANGVTFKGFKIIPPTAVYFALHASNTPDRINGLTLDDISIDGSKNTAMTFEGVDYLAVTNCTIKNTVAGNAMSLASCKFADLSSITTSGNAWGGIGIYTSNGYVAGGTDDIYIDGTTCNISEGNKIYSQLNLSYPALIENIQIKGYGFTVHNTAGDAAYGKTIAFQKTLDDAIHIAIPIGQEAYHPYSYVKTNPNNASVTESNMFSPTLQQNFWVGQYNPTLLIQTAINNALPGDIINVLAGTYTENININKKLIVKSVSGAPVTTINALTTAATATVNADYVTIDGFSITNVSGKNGIYSQDRNHVIIKNNIISNIGNSDASTGTNFGIGVVCKVAAVDDIQIFNNEVKDITGGNFKSAIGIAIGWSDGIYDITNLIINNNTVSDIKSSILAFSSGGRGASGIQLNHGNKAIYGKTIGAKISNNNISDIEGLWAHGICLEGNTPNALVVYNKISNLIDHKTPTDAVAVMVEDNLFASTVHINYNLFDIPLGVGIQNKMISESVSVDGKYNWWGNCSGPDDYTDDLSTICTSPATGDPTNAGVSCYVEYSPWIGKFTTDMALWLNGSMLPSYVGVGSGSNISTFKDFANCGTGLDAVGPDANKYPKYQMPGIETEPAVEFTRESAYGASDILTIPQNDLLTANASFTDWSPSNGKKTLFVVFKPKTAPTKEYYSFDGKQCIVEFGGPLSGFNIYLHNGYIIFGMWNRFERKYVQYTESPEVSGTFHIYPFNPDKYYVAKLEYNGTNFTCSLYDNAGGALVSSPVEPFKGISKDGSDATGIGGATRTSYHNYNTGETYSDNFNGFIGDVMLFNKELSSTDLNLVQGYFNARYGFDIEPLAKQNAQDWVVYNETNFTGMNELTEAYPNPFDAKTSFTFNLVDAGNVAVELFDAQGQKVKTMFAGQLGSGIHEFTIDGQDLNSGLYMFRVTGDNFSESGKVILNK